MVDNEWKAFEIAVAEFVKRIGDTAKVIPNHHTPDLDSGKRRQRDVWVEHKLFGHYPQKILVSCKHHGRKLHQGDIDAFWGELRSSGAQHGVLYSKRGFSKNAILKAEKLGISCCTLYDNAPPETPEMLSYALIVSQPDTNIRLDARGEVRLANFTQILDSVHLHENKTVFEIFSEWIIRVDRESHSEFLKTRLPIVPLQRKVTIGFGDESTSQLDVTYTWSRVLFKAKHTYCLVNGSYEFISGDFRGRISGPEFRIDGELQDEAWCKVEKSEFPLNTGCFALIWLLGDFRVWLKEIKSFESIHERVKKSDPPTIRIDINTP